MTQADHMKPTEDLVKAVREEIVRQYRDDDRHKAVTGAPFWEEHIQPYLIAEVVLKHLAATPQAIPNGEYTEHGGLIADTWQKVPTLLTAKMVDAGLNMLRHAPDAGAGTQKLKQAWDAMLSAAPSTATSGEVK